MRGIKETAGATKKYCQKNGYGHTVQINFDPETKEIWYDEHISSGSWTPYDAPVMTFHTSVPMTMKEIKEMLKGLGAEI